MAGPPPALTGAIMCMGVATANSILVVSFARERLADLIRQALAAPKRRIATRPTLGSQRRRLKAKTVRGEVKTLRGKVDDGE